MSEKSHTESNSEPSVEFHEMPAALPACPAPAHPAADDAGAIQFSGAGLDDASRMDSEHAPVAPAADATPGDAPDPDASDNLEIKWHDEDQPPQAGHLFAEVSREPPPAPFEVVHEPRPPHRRHHEPVSPRPDAAPEKAAHRPSLWIRMFWGFMPLTLLLLGYASVIMTQKGVGHAWDEAYYYDPSLKAADWLIEVLRGHKPFGKEAIDAAWAGIHEHPSLQKFVSGIALRNFPDPKMHLYAMRLPIAIFFGLTLTLIYRLGRRVWGPVPGLIAALIYWLMPRVFGHAHFASMETPLIFVMLLTVYCFLKGLDEPFWAAMTGVSFGVLLSTKINGFFLPVPLIIWAHLYARQRYVNNLFAMLFLGPAVFVLTWPWLWPDPVMRLLEYLAFHAQHQQTAVFFLGQKWGYGGPNAPWFYPWAVLGATLPLSSMALILWGVLRTLAALPRRPIGALYLLCALTMLAVASAPGTPKYDGERLFLPVFAFLALLGGSGAVGLLVPVERLVGRAFSMARGRRTAQLILARWAAVAIALVVILDGGSAIVRYRPYWLSYFNPLVGGLRGVYENRLFESTYWGESLNDEVIAALNRLPPGTTVKTLALHKKCLDDLQIWGLLDQDLVFDVPKRTTVNGVSLEYYDYHLLQMRQGFFTGPERALALTGNTQFAPRLWGWGEGKAMVPLIGLYKTGPEFELYWRRLAAAR